MHRRAFVLGAGALATGCRSRVVMPRAPEPAQAERFAELAGLTDGVPPPDAAEFALRRARVQSSMAKLGLAAVVAEPGASMQYLAGVRWGRSERPFLVVLPVEGEPHWVCPAFEERTAREQLGADATVSVWQEHEDPFAVVRRHANGGRVAIDAEARHRIANGVGSATGHPPVVDMAVASTRMAKAEPELARLRRANIATKAALAAAASLLAVGMTQSEFAELVREAQEVAGLADVWALVLFGPAAAFPHGTRDDRALEHGDLVLVDTGGALHGYRSDITRTFPYGQPNPEAQRAWETVARAQAAALETIRPGTPCGEVDAAARAVMVEAGMGADYERFTHRLGHGIGLQVHEPPYLVRDNPLILGPGMTMSNEPGLYAPGVFGARIEDIVAVTASGAEVFGPPVGPFAAPFEGHDVASIKRALAPHPPQ